MSKHNTKYKSTGIIFVILNKQSQAEQLVYMFSSNIFTRTFNFIAIKLFRCKKYTDKRWWDGNRVRVERAAEPTDIFWQNMSVTFLNRLRHRLVSLTITLALLGVAFGINFSLTSLSKSVEDEADKSEEEFIQNANRFIALLRSIVVSVMNVVLKKMMLKLALLEKDNTITKYNLSVTLKYFVVTAINTVLIPVVTNLDKDTWFLAGGLVVEVFFNLVLLCFITPLFYLVSVPILIKKVKIAIEKRKGVNCKLTQREL